MTRTRAFLILIMLSLFLSTWQSVLFWFTLPLHDSPPSVSCAEELARCRSGLQRNVNHASGTPIYLITPTYSRPVQKAELTRLVHTLLHVENLHWVLVEDSPRRTDLVTKLLEKSGLRYTHLNAYTPLQMKANLTRGDKRWSKPRGVLQRNEGLRWLHFVVPSEGVVYFADDDNTYDLELFSEMRSIIRVGVWPVAFVGEILVEKPLVLEGRVVGWDVAYKPERPFAMDMAGFAVNVQEILRYPEATFDSDQPVGYQETYFLKKMWISLVDLEPKADNCTKVLVWHTRMEKVNVIQEKKWNAQGKRSDDGIEI